MVQINLLPATLKKKRAVRLELKVSLTPVVFALVAALAVIALTWSILGIRLNQKRRKISRLNEELTSLKFTLQKLEKLKQDRQQFSQKLDFIQEQLRREMLWAENLNRLSNLLPPGIWLKQIILHTKQTGFVTQYQSLDIRGTVVSLHSQEMIDLIGELMTALKQDAVFGQQFSEIKLISSQIGKGRDKIKTMSFKLSCQYKRDRNFSTH